MAATSGSDGRASAAAPAAGSLESLSNPRFASMTAADLVVHLFGVRRASEFADAALVLSARERSAAAAEARIRAAEEVAGRLREELAARALETEAQMRRATETEERLRAEIRALECRADEAEARAGLRPSDASGRDRARGEVGPKLGARGPAAASEEGGGAGVDPDDDISWRDDVDRTVAAGDDDRAGVEREDGEIEADGADVDPDDTLTLKQYLQKLKLLRGGECFAAESESVSNARDSDARENLLHALAVVCQDQENLLPPAPLLQAIRPTPGTDLSPIHVLKAKNSGKTGHEGGPGEDDKPQSSAMHSKGGGITLQPRTSVVPTRATSNKPREKGIFYKMVFEALKEKERITLAKAAASQQPNLRCWLYAPLPYESADAEEDPHGQAPQK
uniref:Uncharacterized protein n=1 Tax=Setaria viridis TaxID=4556 RepID=A0A4U6W2F1_SETVI|nr:hypothetical protein SEVIR_2G323700v2 [Setaria viridis]